MFDARSPAGAGPACRPDVADQSSQPGPQRPHRGGRYARGQGVSRRMTGVLQMLDSSALRRWTDVSVDLLDDCRAELDRINVFPVPDSDTGTNLLLTVRAAADAVARALSGPSPEPGVAAVAAAAADGALRGAR